MNDLYMAEKVAVLGCSEIQPNHFTALLLTGSQLGVECGYASRQSVGCT